MHSSLKFKDKDKATKQDDKGDEIDPELIPSNIISKTHWRNAQLAIFESFGMSIHQQSLKAKGVSAVSSSISCSCLHLQADFLKWRKEYMEYTNSAGESEPFPNTRTAALRMETRKKLAAEFVTLRVSVCACLDAVVVFVVVVVVVLVVVVVVVGVDVCVRVCV